MMAALLMHDVDLSEGLDDGWKAESTLRRNAVAAGSGIESARDWLRHLPFCRLRKYGVALRHRISSATLRAI